MMYSINKVSRGITGQHTQAHTYLPFVHIYYDNYSLGNVSAHSYLANQVKLGQTFDHSHKQCLIAGTEKESKYGAVGKKSTYWVDWIVVFFLRAGQSNNEFCVGSLTLNFIELSTHSAQRPPGLQSFNRPLEGRCHRTHTCGILL